MVALGCGERKEMETGQLFFSAKLQLGNSDMNNRAIKPQRPGYASIGIIKIKNVFGCSDKNLYIGFFPTVIEAETHLQIFPGRRWIIDIAEALLFSHLFFSQKKIGGEQYPQLMLCIIKSIDQVSESSRLNCIPFLFWLCELSCILLVTTFLTLPDYPDLFFSCVFESEPHFRDVNTVE